MTVVLNKQSDFDPARWSTMPGWNITVDLTPAELRARRSLAALRRVVAIVLVFVILLCVGGYLLAAHANSQAQADVDAASADTTRIQATLGQYSAVTQVKAATSAIEAQLATLFSADVDIPKLIASIPSPAANHLTITSINVSLTATTAAATTGTGAATIGTVTMSGSALHLTDLAAEVTALNRVSGVTNVIPTSNSTGGSGTSTSSTSASTSANSTTRTSWSLTFELTDALYTHRFSSAPASAATTSATPTTNGGK